MAVIVGAPHTPENIGRLVMVIGTPEPGTYVDSSGLGRPVWTVCCVAGRPLVQLHTLIGKRLAPTKPHEDRLLRPIRDQPGQDETLTWKTKETV